MGAPSFGGRLAVLVAVTGLALWSCQNSPSTETLGTSRNAVSGSSAQVWTGGATSPWGGTAFIAINYTTCALLCPNGNPPVRGSCGTAGSPSTVCSPQQATCSGTLIARDLVLTAGHCLCDTDVDSVNITFPGDFSQDVGGGAHFWTFVDDCEGTYEDDGSKDLAMIRLAGNVPDSLVASPLFKPWLGDLNSLLKSPGGFFVTDTAGYGGNSGPDFGPPLIFATYSGAIHTDDDNWFSLGISSGSWWIYMDRSGAGTNEGDSGGPLAILKNSDQAWYQIAVTHGGITGVPGQGTRDTFTPLQNNGDGNGSWIAGFLSDADDDQVTDSLDNCNPSSGMFAQCARSVYACANQDQADTDGDGIGDVCDNCPTAWNPSQSNIDGDLFGDACDGCPYMTGDNSDSDGDGVWNSCDNCGLFNNYAFCYTDADCGPGVCRENGQCSVQLDDTDGDGVGGDCDACPTVIETDRLANSNDLAEARRGVNMLQDICDPVPLYVAQAVLDTTLPGVVPGPGGDRTFTNTLEFTASAQIGHDVTNLGTPTPAESLPRVTYNGRAGFRYCDCDTSEGPLGQESCIASRCAIDPHEYGLSDSDSNWKHLTVATSAGDYPPLSADLARGAEISRTFTSDLAATFTSDKTVPRLGAVESLFWTFWKDLSVNGQGGDVASKVRNGITEVNGLFWTHGLGSGSPSSRDSVTSKELRDSYGMVSGPYFRSQLPHLPLSHCLICGWWIDPGIWQIFGGAIVDPGPEGVIRPPDLWGGITRIRPDINEILGQRDNDTYDLGQLFGSDVLGELKQPNRNWATPVESTNDRIKRGIASVFASVESPWTGTVPIREFLAGSNGNVVLSPAAPTPALVPGARSGARAVLSAFEHAVYLVGGSTTASDGTVAATSEIWRNDLKTGEWTALGREGKVVGAALQSVAATTYDWRTRQLYVLSNIKTTTAFGTQTALRLTAVDTKLGTARTLSDMPTLATSGQVTLAITRDQTLVLATQKGAQTVQVYELDPKQTRPTWIGYAALQGELDGDIFAPGEVFVPIVSSGVSRIKTVTRATLRQKVGAGSAGDQDLDGIVDVLDDCPNSYNPTQQGCPSPSDAVLYASYRLTLTDRVKTSTGAALVSAGTQPTVVGVDAKVGPIQSKGSVTLKDRARSSGTVTSSGSITLVNGASAVATKANAALNIGSLTSFAITFPPAGAPVTLSSGQKKTITPGSYGDVHIYANSVLTLSAGDYYFQSLFVEPQAVVAIDSQHGPVRVFAKNGLTYRGGLASLDGGSPASMFLLGYLGTAQAPIESAFDGTIVAPNAKLVLSSLVHNGGFYAREIEVQAGATINYVPNTFSWLPTQ